MQKIHGGSGIPHGTMRGKGASKPEATTSGVFHGGTTHVKGRVHEAPTRPMVNDQNYAGHKIGKRK
jgi:hypothetical protein